MGEMKKLVDAAKPQHSGLTFDVILARAGVPYNLCCGGPPPPSRKYVLHDLSVSQVKLSMFCRLNPNILPDWVTVVVTVFSGFSSTMEVDGAVVKLEAQRFFAGERPFEGSPGALLELVHRRY